MVCVRVCSPKPLSQPASLSTETKFCSLAKGPGEADDGQEDEDEEDVDMAESLHSTCSFSTVPEPWTGAAAAPGVNVISTDVVMVTVAVPPSVLALAEAWQ